MQRGGGLGLEDFGVGCTNARAWVCVYDVSLRGDISATVLQERS